MPPINDNFADAAIITGTAGTWTGTNTEATHEPGEPAGAYTGGSSVWLSWTCPADGLYVFDTFGSAVSDTTLEVFVGSVLADFVLLWADDDAPDPDPAHNAWGNSQVGVQGVAGTVYYVRVDGSTWDALTVNWQPRTVNPAATVRFYDHDVLTDAAGYSGRMVLTVPPFTPLGNGTVGEFDVTVTVPAEDGGHTIGMWFGVDATGSAALAAGTTIDTAALPSWVTYHGGRRIPSRSISSDMAGASMWDSSYDWIYPLGFAFTIDPASDPDYWRMPPPPTITSVTPSGAPMNISVTVRGTSFVGVIAVKIAGGDSVFTVVSDTELTVVVPDSASAGATTLSVLTNSGTATVPFTVTAPPSIAAVYPNPVRPGCALRATGPNLQYVTRVQMWRTTGGLADVDFFFNNATTELVVHVPEDARLTPPIHMGPGDPSLFNLAVSAAGGPVSKASVGVVQLPTPTEANPFGKMWKVEGGEPLLLWGNGDVTQIKQVADGVWIVVGGQYDAVLHDYRVMAQIVVDEGGGTLSAGAQVVVADPDGTINIAVGGYVVVAPLPGTDLVVVGWEHLDDNRSLRNTWQVLRWSTSTLSLAGPALTFGAASPTSLSIGGLATADFFEIAAAGISGSRVVLFGGANDVNPPGSSGFGQNYDAGYRHFLVYHVSAAGFDATPIADGIQENGGGIFDAWRVGAEDVILARRYDWGTPTTHTWLVLSVLPDNSVTVNYYADMSTDNTLIETIVPHYTDGDALTGVLEFLGGLYRPRPGGGLQFFMARLDPGVSVLTTGPVVFGDGQDALDGWGLSGTAYSVGYLGIAALVSPDLHEMSVVFGSSSTGGAVAFVVDSDGYASPAFDFGPNLNGLGWEWHGWVPYGPRPGNAPIQALVALGGQGGGYYAAVTVVSIAELTVPCEPFRRPVAVSVASMGGTRLHRVSGGVQ